MSDTPIKFRDLSTVEDCRAVVGIQEAVWGRDGETVPASVLLVSAKRGGILIGAELAEVAERRGGGTEGIVGFVWSMPGRRGDQHTHWSHMLGVLPALRGQRIAEGLKHAQRERALAAGVELIEWTFDPLQAVNAHLNMHVLGAIGADYLVDAYGALQGPLHRGTPTDRLIVEWRLKEPHVELRRGRRSGANGGGTRLVVRNADVASAPVAITTRTTGEWLTPVVVEPAISSPRILVPVPPRYSEMQQDATDIAFAWRLAMREVLTASLARGYRAVDFHLDREHGGGTYVLARG